MGFDLGKRRQSRDTCKVPVDGEEITVTFNRNAMNQKALRILRRLGREDTTDEQEREAFRLYTEVIVDWDITEGGRKVPIEVETLEGLDIFLLGDIIRHVTESMVPEGSIPPTNAAN